MDFEKTFNYNTFEQTKNIRSKELFESASWSVISGIVFGIGHAIAIYMYI